MPKPPRTAIPWPIGGKAPCQHRWGPPEAANRGRSIRECPGCPRCNAVPSRLLRRLPVFRQPVFSFLQSERKLGTGNARRNPRAACDDAKASMMRALADFFQSISLGLSEASDMLFLRIAHRGTPEPVQLSLHGMPVSCAKEPCVTGDDDFGSALLRWQVLAHFDAAPWCWASSVIAPPVGVRQVFVDWQVPRGGDASRPQSSRGVRDPLQK